MASGDDDWGGGEMEALIQRMGTGEVKPEAIPEIIRAIRHVVINQFMATRYVRAIAKEADTLAKKALDKVDEANERIDDITGKPGQKHIDGGGALGRIQSSQDRIERLVARAQWGFLAACGVGAVDVVIHFLPH